MGKTSNILELMKFYQVHKEDVPSASFLAELGAKPKLQSKAFLKNNFKKMYLKFPMSNTKIIRPSSFLF